jgi:hypothetical protein
MITTHLDLAPMYWSARPEWIGAKIPACSCDGDTDEDFYTTDADKVTCSECLTYIAEGVTK